MLLVVGWEGTCNNMYVRKLDRFEDIHCVQIIVYVNAIFGFVFGNLVCIIFVIVVRQYIFDR